MKIDTTSEHICEKPISVQKLYDLREEGRVKTVINSSALINKSIMNLLPSEGKLILESLIQQNASGSTKKVPKRDIMKRKIRLIQKNFWERASKNFA